ncbi:NEW3 domain-containing protein [Candidatus Omnitrophota bacterium]
MSRLRAMYSVLCFVLLFGIIGGFFGGGIVLADEEKLEVINKYPILEHRSGEAFDFEVVLMWHSTEFRVFNINTDALPGWKTSVLGGYDKKEIGGRIGVQPLEPDKTYPTEAITVRLSPLGTGRPEPGEYPVNLTITSGEISETVELKAVVTAVYGFAFASATGLVNTEVKAGDEQHFSVIVVNNGTAPLDKISLLSQEPSGWIITYNPENVEGLDPGTAQEVDVVISPPRETVAGDYYITLESYGADLPWQEMKLRVTVLTPTGLAWIGIVIVLLVIAGVVVMFMRLGRR